MPFPVRAWRVLPPWTRMARCLLQPSAVVPTAPALYFPLIQTALVPLPSMLLVGSLVLGQILLPAYYCPLVPCMAKPLAAAPVRPGLYLLSVPMALIFPCFTALI